MVKLGGGFCGICRLPRGLNILLIENSIYIYNIYSFEAGKIIFLPLLTGFYFVLVFRLGLAALRNRWFRLWVRLELNIISFIPILTARGSVFQLENRVKYFLTQAVASL